jgi:hypothetical protein
VLRQQDERVNASGAAWLSSATRDPRATRYVWSIDPGARQPVDTGQIFDAVVIRANLGTVVLRALVAARVPLGAVVSASYADKWAYLVGPGSGDAWRSAVGPSPAPSRAGWYHYVGPRGCLTIPGPLPHPDTSMRWIARPGLDTNLTCLTSLATAYLQAVPTTALD